jgi:hypothetical protein
MITFPYGMPATPGFRVITWNTSGNTSFTESTFTRQRQYFRFLGDLLRAEVEIPKMTPSVAAPWRGWGAAMRGRFGTFLLAPSETSPRGVGTGTPLIKGANQTGDTLETDGWTASKTGILKAGDWIHFWEDKTVLHMVLKDANSDGSGNATLELFPRVRIAPADNAAIQTINTQGTFRLDDDSFAWTVEPGPIYTLRFRAVEDI